MSTLQHVSQPTIRTRVALALIMAGAVAALVVALIVSSAARTDPFAIPSGGGAHPSQAQIQRQIEAAAGPRYGIARPQANRAAGTPAISPQRQLEAVAGARYHQPVGIHAQP